MRIARHVNGLKLVALFCLLLVPITLSLEICHFHSAYEASSKSCPICTAAHATTPVVVTAALMASPIFFSAQRIHIYESQAQHRALAFELSVRPPPAS